MTHRCRVSALDVLPIGQAAFDAFELREAAAFLLDEIVFDDDAVFGRLEDAGKPRRKRVRLRLTRFLL